MNLKFTTSPIIGTSTSIVYFLINGMFLGNVFFEKQQLFLRFIFGNLLLIVLLALVAWAVMIIYNLDTIMSAFVLCVVTAVCSFLNKMIK
jgi:membrane protein DedA with SNARE-associated domain